MNKNLILILVVLLALFGIGGFFMLSNKNSSSSNTPDGKNTQTQSQTLSNKSLRDLMAMTTSQTCTFTDDQQNTGTVYAGNGKFRTDFTSTVNNQATTTHMVSDSANIYMWVDGSTEGFKLPLTTVDNQQNNTTTQSVDVNKQVNFDCKSWSTDESKFTLPDLKFTDFGSMMQQIAPTSSTSQDETESPSTTNAAQCAACASLTGESATQCKKALNCN